MTVPVRPITKVLVANRGEIAVRVIRACRELGIASVAVASDADRRALHARLADEVVAIGPPEPRASYLDMERILAAAAATGADAVHPGYGFLAENATFARRCAEAGLVFIGPDADTILAMGEKTAARAVMQAAGVPVVPGALLPEPGPDGELDAAAVEAAARSVGFPLMVKAAFGGGGKGMRLVRDPAQVAASCAAAAREALKAFGDGKIYLEKFIERPRHVEFQVFGDRHGNAVHLFERECSVQRRHQKVIEESPSPSLTPELRASICEAAVQTAKAVNYRGAGTVEFILSPDGGYYFLEMNTRLQVEHPVTEMVTGTDLVRAMVLIAQGDGLCWTQDELQQRGWAMEFRLYAEDPSRGFAPSIGRIEGLTVPLGPGVRLDTGVYEGFDVPINYDPMLSKLIVWAEDRDLCIARAKRVLGEFVLHGPVHNLPFHLWVLDQPAFRDGSYTTHFVGDCFDPNAWLPALDDERRTALIAAAALFEAQRRSGQEVSPAETRGCAPSNWRLTALRRMTGNG